MGPGRHARTSLALPASIAQIVNHSSKRDSAPARGGVGVASGRSPDSRSAPREFAQQSTHRMREQRRDLGGGVLVDAVQADEGVEDDEARPQAFDLGQPPRRAWSR